MLIHLFLLLSLTFASVSSLQTPKSKPDFTGIWNARIVADANDPVQLLRISYNDPKLEISRILVEGTPLKTKGGRNFVFYTDGRGETQKPAVFDDSVKTTTHRVNEKFVTTARWTLKPPNKKATIDQTLTLEVSSNGELLTETITLVSERDTSRVVHLYDRVSGANTRDINGDWKQRKSDRLISLTVEHHDPEIKVTRRVVTDTKDETETSVYYTDGRGETNVKDGRPTKSITKWKGQNLSFSFSNRSTTAGMTVYYNELIKWETSNGGQNLIQVTEETTSWNRGFFLPPAAAKLIFARSSSQLP